jgi:hypothetical protein
MSLFISESSSTSIASFHLIQSENCLHSAMVLGSRSLRRSATMVEKHELTTIVVQSSNFFVTSIIDGIFLHPIKLIMISQYERIRVFRSSSLLGSVHMRAGLWIYHIHLVSINFWLTCIYFLRGSSFPRSL